MGATKIQVNKDCIPASNTPIDRAGCDGIQSYRHPDRVGEALEKTLDRVLNGREEIHLGRKGEVARTIQRSLKGWFEQNKAVLGADYRDLAVDGLIGKHSGEAIQIFQKHNGIKSGSHVVVGPATTGKLREAGLLKAGVAHLESQGHSFSKIIPTQPLAVVVPPSAPAAAPASQPNATPGGNATANGAVAASKPTPPPASGSPAVSAPALVGHTANPDTGRSWGANGTSDDGLLDPLQAVEQDRIPPGQLEPTTTPAVGNNGAQNTVTPLSVVGGASNSVITETPGAPAGPVKVTDTVTPPTNTAVVHDPSTTTPATLATAAGVVTTTTPAAPGVVAITTTPSIKTASGARTPNPNDILTEDPHPQIGFAERFRMGEFLQTPEQMVTYLSNLRQNVHGSTFNVVDRDGKLYVRNDEDPVVQGKKVYYAVDPATGIGKDLPGDLADLSGHVLSAAPGLAAVGATSLGWITAPTTLGASAGVSTLTAAGAAAVHVALQQEGVWQGYIADGQTTSANAGTSVAIALAIPLIGPAARELNEIPLVNRVTSKGGELGGQLLERLRPALTSAEGEAAPAGTGAAHTFLTDLKKRVGDAAESAKTGIRDRWNSIRNGAGDAVDDVERETGDAATRPVMPEVDQPARDIHVPTGSPATTPASEALAAGARGKVPDLMHAIGEVEGDHDFIFNQLHYTDGIPSPDLAKKILGIAEDHPGMTAEALEAHLGKIKLALTKERLLIRSRQVWEHADQPSERMADVMSKAEEVGNAIEAAATTLKDSRFIITPEAQAAADDVAAAAARQATLAADRQVAAEGAEAGAAAPVAGEVAEGATGGKDIVGPEPTRPPELIIKQPAEAPAARGPQTGANGNGQRAKVRISGDVQRPLPESGGDLGQTLADRAVEKLAARPGAISMATKDFAPANREIAAAFARSSKALGKLKGGGADLTLDDIFEVVGLPLPKEKGVAAAREALGEMMQKFEPTANQAMGTIHNAGVDGRGICLVTVPDQPTYVVKVAQGQLKDVLKVLQAAYKSIDKF